MAVRIRYRAAIFIPGKEAENRRSPNFNRNASGKEGKGEQ
jgi:hypothetical protein|nr:MAG TPA: hypothetical protein [Caudoviricetes sp.]